jgi:DNA-directed RNA polymerase specialized sigma24 family protein
MPSTSPALLSTPADRINHAGIPIGCRPLEPDGESRQDSQRAFELQFSRNHELLYFIACRILNHPQEAEEAVKNCLHTASENPPDCGSEGAFKSWLVRILIDEATLLLRKKQSNPAAASNHLSAPRSEAR